MANMVPSSQKGGHMFLLYFTMFIITAVIFFFTLAAIGDPTDIFFDDIVDIIPGGVDTHFAIPVWSEYIWLIVAAWQVVWIVYAATLTCRGGIDGCLLYSPAILPWYFFFIYVIGQAFFVTVLFVLDLENEIIGCIFLVLSTIMLVAAVFTSAYQLHQERETLMILGHDNEPGLCVGFVHNGVALYASFLGYQTLLVFAMMLQNDVDVDMATAATVALSIYGFVHAIWTLVDNIALDNYTRWLVTPYIAIVVLQCGVVVHNYERTDPKNAYLMATVMTVAVLSLIAKFIVAIYRECTQNDYPQDATGMMQAPMPQETKDPMDAPCKFYMGASVQRYQY